RVERPDLVEVDLLSRYAVDAPFGLGEPGEDLEGEPAHWLGEIGALEQRAHCRPGPVGWVLDEDLDVDLRGPHPGALHLGASEPDGARDDGVDGVLQHG